MDDTALGCTGLSPDELLLSFSEQEAMRRSSAVSNLAILSQEWEKLLFSTGGGINLTKSFWFLMSWTWKDGIATLTESKNSPCSLRLTAGYEREPTEIPRIEPMNTYWTLGAYISPSGSTTETVIQLRKISMNYSSSITGSHLSRQDALYSFLLYFQPKVGFSLPVLSLSEEDCDFIQSPAINAALPKLHINRKTSRAIIFGPQDLGGLGLPHLYPHYGVKKLNLFLGHLRLGDKTVKLIMIGLSHLQLILGISKPFYNEPICKYKPLAPLGWLTSVWELSSKCGLTLIIDNHWLPSIQRNHDFLLMEGFLREPNNKSTIIILNRCRLYLQVLTMSDITSADGRYILPGIKEGHRHNDRKSTLNWPQQARPPVRDWKVWSRALGFFETRGQLTTPLGEWTNPSHQTWLSFIDPFYHYYQMDAQNYWQKFRPISYSTCQTTRGRRGLWYDTTPSATTPPSGKLYPATKQTDLVAMGSLFKVNCSTSQLVFLEINRYTATIRFVIQATLA